MCNKPHIPNQPSFPETQNPDMIYSGTSINAHLIKAVTYRITASIAGPEHPPYVHNILLCS